MLPQKNMVLLGLLVLAAAVYYYWEEIQASLNGQTSGAPASEALSASMPGTAQSYVVTEVMPEVNPVTLNSTPVSVTVPVTTTPDPAVDDLLVAYLRNTKERYNLTSVSALSSKVRAVTAWVKSVNKTDSTPWRYVEIMNSQGVSASNAAIKADIERYESLIFA